MDHYRWITVRNSYEKVRSCAKTFAHTFGDQLLFQYSLVFDVSCHFTLQNILSRALNRRNARWRYQFFCKDLLVCRYSTCNNQLNYPLYLFDSDSLNTWVLTLMIGNIESLWIYFVRSFSNDVLRNILYLSIYVQILPFLCAFWKWKYSASNFARDLLKSLQYFIEYHDSHHSNYSLACNSIHCTHQLQILLHFLVTLRSNSQNGSRTWFWWI